MSKNKHNIYLVELPSICLCIFFVLQVISMFYYPGGTFLNLDTEEYSFTKNFLSDLGRSVSFSGKNNFISSQLFNTSLMVAGGVFIMFYYNVIYIFVEYNYTIVAFGGTVFGILGGIMLITVGLTPSDLYFSSHVIAAKWLFRSFFISSICYATVIYLSNLFDNKDAVGYVLFALSIFLYIIISEFGPSPKESEFALTIQVVSQKIILIIMFMAVYMQTLGLKKLRSLSF